MKIGITGASGMLGAALVTHLSKKYDILATSRGKGVEGENINWSCFDLTDVVLLDKWLDSTKPDVVIHCAAIVNVDSCEDNVDLAVALHFKTTSVISNYLNCNNGRLIYISTDSVFDGEKQDAYDESDSVNPSNVYAKTKLMGEDFVRSMSSGLVLRTNIIGWTQEGRISFAEWVLKRLINNEPVSLFYDVYFSPLTVYDLSLIIERIIENPIFGLYHCASSDGISKYEFGLMMAKIFQLSDVNIDKVSVDSMKFKARRPKNMTLDIKKISSTLRYDFPTTLDAIRLMKYQYDKNNNLLN
jgi:dTDP-4-dehydrorhamnose reductase